jgi:hypothetical protein
MMKNQKSRTNQQPNKSKTHATQKQKPKTKQKKHPKRKIGIVNKASSVEKRCLVHHGGIIVWRERTKHDTEKSKTCAIHKDM